jgi:hypothetical protein
MGRAGGRGEKGSALRRLRGSWRYGGSNESRAGGVGVDGAKTWRRWNRAGREDGTWDGSRLHMLCIGLLLDLVPREVFIKAEPRLYSLCMVNGLSATWPMSVFCRI